MVQTFQISAVIREKPVYLLGTAVRSTQSTIELSSETPNLTHIVPKTNSTTDQIKNEFLVEQDAAITLQLASGWG